MRFVNHHILPESHNVLMFYKTRGSLPYYNRRKFETILLSPGSEDGVSSFPVIWHGCSGLRCPVARGIVDENNRELGWIGSEALKNVFEVRK